MCCPFLNCECKGTTIFLIIQIFLLLFRLFGVIFLFFVNFSYSFLVVLYIFSTFAHR